MLTANAKREAGRLLDLLVLAFFYLYCCHLETTPYFSFCQLPFVLYFCPSTSCNIMLLKMGFSRLPIATTAHSLHLLHSNVFIRSHLPVLRRASARRISTFDFYLSLHRAEDARPISGVEVLIASLRHLHLYAPHPHLPLVSLQSAGSCVYPCVLHGLTHAEF